MKNKHFFKTVQVRLLRNRYTSFHQEAIVKLTPVRQRYRQAVCTNTRRQIVVLFPESDADGPKAATFHQDTHWSQLFMGWSQSLLKVMKKTVSDCSCLNPTLHLVLLQDRKWTGFSPSPRYLANHFTLTCILTQLNSCYVARATQGWTCSYTPTPHARGGDLPYSAGTKPFLPVYYAPRKGGAMNAFQKNHTRHEHLGCLKPGHGPGFMPFSNFHPSEPRSSQGFINFSSFPSTITGKLIFISPWIKHTQWPQAKLPHQWSLLSFIT